MSVCIQHNPAGLRPRRVFLAIPSYGPVDGICAFSLFRVHPDLQAAGFDVEMLMLLGDCHVDDSRNSLVKAFLDSDCDDLVFIDSDVGFQSKDIINLLNYDRDVVGGAYPKKTDIPTYPVWLEGGEIWSDRDGLIEVIGIGTGFLRIRRNVLEQMAEKAEKYKTANGDTVPLVFERKIVDGVRYSGDIAFCHKWREMGGKVYVDPNCYLEHRGSKSWSGTYAAHLRSENGLGLVTGIDRIRAGTETDPDYFDLAMEWGNDGFAAGPELMKASVIVARQVKGCVLETGSGLTTLLMAAANKDLTIHCLEHKAEWAAKLEQAAERLGLSNIVIHRVEMKDYPTGKWYDVPRLPWDQFELVLCDGPPRQEGFRRILFGVMATHDCRPKCILVDDVNTEGDSIPAPYKTEIKGQLRKFAVGMRN